MLVYLELATVYLLLGYPDLAAGSAYKALLLTDAVRDDSDEYHEQAYEIFAQIFSRIPAETRLIAMERALDNDPERYLTDADICSPDEPIVEDDFETLMAWCENFYQRAMYVENIHQTRTSFANSHAVTKSLSNRSCCAEISPLLAYTWTRDSNCTNTTTPLWSSTEPSSISSNHVSESR